MSRKKKTEVVEETAPVETVTQEEADKLVESGEATIPSDAVISEKKTAQPSKGMSGHKKFDKFKK